VDGAAGKVNAAGAVWWQERIQNKISQKANKAAADTHKQEKDRSGLVWHKAHQHTGSLNEVPSPVLNFNFGV
jgi:hypothetical protein